MDRELFEKAQEIYEELEWLENKKKRLLVNANPRSMVEIKVNQCYGDMGESYTNIENFKGEIAHDIFFAVVGVIDKYIGKYSKELEAV